MKNTELTQEQKDRIISECINTRKTFAIIARENNVNMEDVYSIMNEYCKANNYINFIRKRKSVVFEKKDGNVVRIVDGKTVAGKSNKQQRKEERQDKKIGILKEIEEWSRENKRKPRCTIKGIQLAEKGEKETAEQKEMRLGQTLNNIKIQMKKYEGKSLEEINDDEIEVVKIIRELDAKYNKKLKKVKEIEEWCNQNERRPRVAITGITVAKKGEKETAEQKEMRLGQTLNNIKRQMKEYDGKSLEDIEDEGDREILEILRRIYSQYKKNKTGRKKEESPTATKTKNNKTKLNLVQTLGNEKMSRMILNLIKTRNATEKQVKEIADFYGVNLDKVQNVQEER